MNTKDIIKYMVKRLKEREIESIEKKKKYKPWHPDYDWILNYDIDYRYYAEVIEEMLESGLFIVPKDEKELESFERDIYGTFVKGTHFHDVHFLRKESKTKDGKISETPDLVRILNIYKSDKDRFEIPEYRMRLDMNQIVNATPEQLDIMVQSGCYCGTRKSSRYTDSKYYGDKDINDWYGASYHRSISQYYYDNCSFINGKMNLKLTIPSTVELNDESIARLCEFLKKTQEFSDFKIGDIDISFNQRNVGEDETRYRFNRVTMGQIENLHKALTDMGANVHFAEYNTKFNGGAIKWNFEQLKTANNHIDDLANMIKEKGLSPLEAVLFVSAWAKQNLNYNEKSNDLEMSNTILAAAKFKEVQCVGFVEFVNAVLSAAGLSKEDNNEFGCLSAKKITCTTKKDEKGNIIPDHCQSLIHIEDHKYDVNGDYICDINAGNFVSELTQLLNGKLSELDDRIPSIEAFNSLCLKNLDEYKAILPNYTIFPYLDTDQAEIAYDRQISLSDVDKYNRMMRRANDWFSGIRDKDIDEQLKDSGINYTKKPIKVEGIDYDEYMDYADEIMEELKETQGGKLFPDMYVKAYCKVLPIIYPELLSDSELFKKTVMGILLMNTTVDSFVEESKVNKRKHKINKQ